VRVWAIRDIYIKATSKEKQPFIEKNQREKRYGTMLVFNFLNVYDRNLNN